MAEDSNVERHPPRATEGKTRVGDIYRPSDDHALIGFLAPASRMIYFAEYAMERVKTKFGVHKVTGNVWISTHPIFRGEYTAAAMTTLNLNQTLHAGMATVNEKSECDKFPKGKCINFYEEDGTFSYSWKPSEDVFLCKWSKTQDCTDIWKKMTIDACPEKTVTAIRRSGKN